MTCSELGLHPLTYQRWQIADGEVMQDLRPPATRPFVNKTLIIFTDCISLHSSWLTMLITISYMLLTLLFAPGEFGLTDDFRSVDGLPVKPSGNLRCYQKLQDQVGDDVQYDRRYGRAGRRSIFCIRDPIVDDKDGSRSLDYLASQDSCEHGLETVLYRIAKDSFSASERRLAAQIWSDYLHTELVDGPSDIAPSLETIKWLKYAGDIGLDRAYLFAGDWASMPFSDIGRNPSLSVALYKKSHLTADRYATSQREWILSGLFGHPVNLPNTIGAEYDFPRCAGQEGYYFVASSQEIDGRSGPGVTFSVVMSLAPYTEVEEVERRDAWSRVRLTGGATVWVASEVLK